MTTRSPRIIGYLNSFREDMAVCPTELHRAKVRRIYRHERWMHNWTAHYDGCTNTPFAMRRFRITGLVEFAFPLDTDPEVCRSIEQRYSPNQPCTP